jgi:hypothetical protein
LVSEGGDLFEAVIDPAKYQLGSGIYDVNSFEAPLLVGAAFAEQKRHGIVIGQDFDYDLDWLLWIGEFDPPEGSNDAGMG